MNLILSNNQEELCKKFLSILKNNPPSDDPFSQDVILTQSFAMHHYLTLHISDYLKIAMAMRMFYPKTMVKMLYQWFLDEKKSNPNLSASSSDLWEAKNLRWILMEILKKKKPELEEDKCFSVAEEIAHLFDEYLLYRLPMLEKWQKQNRAKKEEKSLQKILWQEVCQILPVKKYPHHSQQVITLKNLFEKKIDAPLKKSLRKICPRLFVFGISRTVPLYIDLWESMAKHTEVFVFTLDYHCQKKSVEKMEGGENWFTHTLKQKRSPKSSHVETIIWQPKKLKFLQAFQRFYLKQPLEKDKKILKSPDDTLIVKKCNNIIDEVEIMCKTIVNLLSGHNSNAFLEKPLHANDILIMAPNIDDYTVLIRDAFQTKGIPFSIADESLQNKNELSSELLDLLPLLKEESEWKLSHICKLAQSEYLSRKWNFYNHRENIEQWLTKARIRWGKKNHPNSLESGIIRLINGYCMWLDDDHFKKDSDFFHKQPQFFFEGSSAEELGNFLEMLDHMQSYKEVSQKHSLKQWCTLTKKIAKTFFEWPGNLLLENFFKKIDTLENQQPDFLKISWQKISLEVFLTVLKQQLEGEKKERDYMTGRITFSSLVPMRAIPFRIVYLLGMGENEFVRTEKKNSSLNLMHEQPMPYDRLRHLEDRQLFLDAFFSAQDYFFISYSEINKNNTAQKNPSTIFLEMINDVEEYLNDEGMTHLDLLGKLTHSSPPNQHDKTFFLDSSTTIEEIKKEVAKKINSSPDEKTATPHQVILSDLCHYFGDPQKSWLKKQGIQSASPLPTADNFNDLEPLNSFEYNPDGPPIYDNYDRRKIADNQLQSLSFWQEPFIDWHTLKDEGCLPHGEMGEKEIEEINQQLGKIYKCGLRLIPELKNIRKKKWERWLFLKDQNVSVSLWGSIDHFSKADQQNDLATNLPLLHCHYAKKKDDKNWPSLKSIMPWIIHSLFYFHINPHHQTSHFITPFFSLTLEGGKELNGGKELLKTYLNAFLETFNDQEHFLPLLPKTSAFLLQQRLTEKWNEEKAKQVWNDEIKKSNTLQISYKNLLDDKKNKQKEWEYLLQTYEKFLIPLEQNLSIKKSGPKK